MDTAETDLLEHSLRLGAEYSRLRIQPSGPDTSGFDCPFIKNVSLSPKEATALGLITIGKNQRVADIILLDYPSEFASHEKLWRSLVTDNDEETAAQVYANIRESLIPFLSVKEISDEGISADGKQTRDSTKAPYSVFLQEYAKGLVLAKKILLVIGHGGSGGSGSERVIGTHSARAFDYTSHLYKNLDLSDYSVVLDTACTEDEFIPDFEKIGKNEASIFFADSEVILFGGKPNELQSSCKILKNGKISSLNWRNIIAQRRSRGTVIY